ncbi:hypothetical protein [uncultured Psychroserpens sp.]|uniref:hypothetical protein n=1 Tax=uncultured Psychroserpens sp. TaxID=255436 RepID=UPI0026286126|nr:hypothetical protein [uncultured Psychroserpens sp.]
MKKYDLIKGKIVLFLFSVFTTLLYCQNKTFYVIDNIPINKYHSDQRIELKPSEISTINYEVDKKLINALGYKSYDTLAYIITKAHSNRSSQIKNIPTKRQMVLENFYWKLNGQNYTGKYIDYYINGSIQEIGQMINGKVNGKVTYFFYQGKKRAIKQFKNGKLDGEQLNFYLNGTVSNRKYYVNNKLNGQNTLYFPNGIVKKEYLSNGEKLQGKVKEYYSTGQLKQIKNTINLGLGYEIKDFNIFFEGHDFRRYVLDTTKEFPDKDKLKKFLKKFDKRITKNPEIDTYYLARGIIKSLLNDTDEAIKEFKKALELEPMHLSANYYLAVVLMKKYKEEDIALIPKKDLSVIRNNFLNASIQDEHPEHNILRAFLNTELISNELKRYSEKQ